MKKVKYLPLKNFISYISRGITPKYTESDGICVLNQKCIRNNRISIVQARKHNIKAKNISNDKLLRKWDILVNSTGTGTLGRVAQIKQDVIATADSHITIVRPNQDVNAAFLGYALKYNQQSIEALAEGSTGQTELSKEKLKERILIPCFEYKEQAKISEILLYLDERLELNEKINQNLEAQAQAIFKSWFVDFEPFDGKMPADWKSGTFSELITNTVGGDWGKDELQDNYTEEVYCIRGADIPDVKIGNRGKMPKRYILQKNYSLKKLNDGDLVVEISGGSPTQSTGRIAAISDYLLNRYKNKIICTNFCKSLKPRKNYSEYVYHYWQYLYDKNIFFGYENGTTGIKNLDISAFLETEPVIIPSQNILVAFAEVCRKTFAQIYHNGYENETLAQLRDALLPKLMSGEIDVSEVAV